MAIRNNIDDCPSVTIETHGCKLNQADSTALAWEFKAAGFRVVPNDQAVDVYVVNSCTVTHVADRKARRAIRAARRRNQQSTVVATGCYPQRAPEAVYELDEADIIAGNDDKSDLVRQVLEWRGQSSLSISNKTASIDFSPRLLRSRAMVKIQHGCDQVCAYCIVPKVRGRERSIPPDRILREIREYLGRGYKEIVLTGTQLGTYGFDLKGIDLAVLVERVLVETDVARLRVSSLQPQEFGDRLLDLWLDGRLCPHFHVPLQSGSLRVLERMRRRYTPEQYATAVDTIRRRVPGCSVTSDVIVGFPGETDADFEQTFRLSADLELSDIHIFPFSSRPGTSAAHFGDQVSEPVKFARKQRMLALAEKNSFEFRRRLVGAVRSVLWETGRKQPNGQMRWTGLTDNYIRVFTDNDSDLTDQTMEARLVEVDGASVRVELM